MALALLARHGLGEVLDIHAGGVDLIFPHHEDEIAQSCAFTGQEYFARYWLHGEFLNVRGTKMSKRFGNITTPRDLKNDGVDAGTIRLLMFQTHYRQKMDLTDEGLEGAREGSRRLGEFNSRLRKTGTSAGSAAWTAWGAALRGRAADALNDDLNAPQAIGALFDAARDGNRLLDTGAQPGIEAIAVWDQVLAVFDILPETSPAATTLRHGEARPADSADLSPTPPADAAEAERWALAWARARLGAKGRRDYKEADRIRDLLRGAGWEIRDNKDGTVEVRRV
jgi:cysteinyl-tRNA synthetase